MGELTTRDTVEVAVAPRNGDEPGDDIATSALATVREVTGEIVRLVRTAATQATDGWSLVPLVRSLLPDLERVVEERTVLGRDARALRAQVGELRERVHELEALIAARETGWIAERAAFEDDVVRERERAEMFGQDLEHRRAEISLLEGRARRLREQTDSAATRADADREKTLRLAREMVQSAEEARIAVVGELETLRATLAAEQARLDETQHERARATQGVVELEADLAHTRQIIEQVEASRAATAAELSRARATLVHTEDELLAVQHEHQLSQAHLEKLCAAHDDMVEEQAQLVAKLHDANEREARLRLRITGLEQRIQAGRDGTTVVIDPPTKAIDAVVQAATAGLTTELARAEERLQVLRDELTQTKAAASAATVRVETLAAEVHTRERARAVAVAELESLRATVTASMPQARVTPEPTQVAVTVLSEATIAEQLAEPSLDVHAPALEETASEPIAETETVGEHGTSPRGPIAVLDTFDAWEGTGIADVHRVGPAPEALDRLRELAPACCVVNLGAPGALEAAAALRRAGMTVPLWGFAMAPNGTALALGRFEVIARPVDPERVRAQLASLAPSDGNAIMVGSDSATQMPIREGLLQLGLSVRTAWNREQAAELADAVEPDLVTIDLGTASAGAAELIVDLLCREKAATIVFVPGAPEYIEVLAAAVGAHGVPIDRAAIVGAAAAKR